MNNDYFSYRANWLVFFESEKKRHTTHNPPTPNLRFAHHRLLPQLGRVQLPLQLQRRDRQQTPSVGRVMPSRGVGYAIQGGPVLDGFDVGGDALRIGVDEEAEVARLGGWVGWLLLFSYF